MNPGRHTVRQTLWTVRKGLASIFLIAAAILIASGFEYSSDCLKITRFYVGDPSTGIKGFGYAGPAHVETVPPAGAPSAADFHPLRPHAAIPTSLGGIERKIDGSYTLHLYETSDPYAQIDVIPNFIASSVASTGYPRRPLQVPAGWRPGGDNQLGVSSYAGVVADLTGSGLLDAVAVFQDVTPLVDVVSVGLSNADYSLRNHTEYPVGINPWTVLAADFNGDGKRDLVVFCAGVYASDGTLTAKGTVSVLINNGDGTFKAAVSYAAGGSPAQGTVQDFNGDGKLDIAAIDQSVGLVTILLGNGDGTFRTGATLSLPQASYVAAADLDGDSKQDLVVVTYNQLAVLLGNGDGTFKAPSMTPLIGNSNPAIGDFNKDGKPDVVVVDFHSQTAQVLFGAGDGTFPTSVRYLLGSLATHVLVSDVDWDGNLDVVIGAGHPDGLTPSLDDVDELSILFGNGDGTFYGPQANPVAAGTYSSAMASADFNGDGRLDIALTAPDGSTQVLLGQSGGGFHTTTIAGGGYGILAKDFNGDGKADLLVGMGSSNTVLFASGNGNGTFQTPVSISTGNPSYSVDAGDLNGDGKLDLVTASSPGYSPSSSPPSAVTVLLGNGNGTFQSPKTVSGFPNPVDAKLADFNGDGKLDLVVVNGATSDSLGNTTPGAGISVLQGKGDGTFQPAVLLYAGGQPTRAFIADINGDGKPDILVLTEDSTTFANQVAVFLNAGNGTFAPAAFIATDSGLSSLAVADLNNDGKADLLITHCCGDAFTTYMAGNGDGTFQPELFLPVASSTSSVIAADFNGDGKMDAAVVASFFSSAPDYLAVLINVTPAVPAVPAAGSTNPGSGSGMAKTFTFTFSDTGGYQNLSVVDVLINNALDGRRACYVAFVPSGATSGSVYLVDDAGDAGGPYQGLVLPGSGTVSNGQCTISGAGSSVVGSGNTLTLTLAIAFSAGFAGNQVVYTSAGDKSSANSGWQALGTWGVPGAAVSGPSVTGMTPARTTSLGPTTYAFTFTDTNGWQDIAVANILINAAIDGRHGCYLAFVPSSNSVLLVDDAGDAGGPYSGMVLPGTGTVSNSQCSISGAGSSVSGSGNTLTLTLSMTFSQTFAGNQIFFLAARNNTLNSNWQAVGSVTVP